MKYKRWSLVLLWMIVIYYWSSIPDLQSGLEIVWDTVLRKVAHLSEYAILSGLIAHAIGRKRWQLELALCLSILYAVSDEIHQLFVLQRTGSVVDVGIDAIGIIIGLLLYRKIFFHDELAKKVSRS